MATKVDALLRAADMAMYEAKRPRNDFRIYHPDAVPGSSRSN